jgi:aspartate aminotransferase-like enzyme
LRPMAEPAYQSDSVTPMLLPSGVNASTLRKQLEELYGFSIAGAQGDYWKQQMVRIGHLGFVYEADIARCLRGLRTLLADATRARNGEAAGSEGRVPEVIVSRPTHQRPRPGDRA